MSGVVLGGLGVILGMLMMWRLPEAICSAVFAVWCGVGAVVSLLQGEWLWLVVNVISTAYWAWVWWRGNRRRRKRWAARCAGIVRDLGHRLAVVPAPTPVSAS